LSNFSATEDTQPESKLANPAPLNKLLIRQS
jgi:hypothetical protein